jgi:pyrroloquinoline-quinone synthase
LFDAKGLMLLGEPFRIQLGFMQTEKMMGTHFIENLSASLDEKHLLKHSYYQKWETGSISMENMRFYASQYDKHVYRFPQHISRLHSICPDFNARQMLLDNLCEEEAGPKNHPALWKAFAAGIGATNLDQTPCADYTQDLIDVFDEQVSTSYARGLGALFAYERQQAEIASTKKRCLIDHYNITNEKTLEFFTVHAIADIEHGNQAAEMLEALSDEEKIEAEIGAKKMANALWNFLSGIEAYQPLAA